MDVDEVGVKNAENEVAAKIDSQRGISNVVEIQLDKLLKLNEEHKHDIGHLALDGHMTNVIKHGNGEDGSHQKIEKHEDQADDKVIIEESMPTSKHFMDEVPIGRTFKMNEAPVLHKDVATAESPQTSDVAVIMDEAPIVRTTYKTIEAPVLHEDVVTEESPKTSDVAVATLAEETIDGTRSPPTGSRWAVSAPGIDLSGKWKIIATEEFKDAYDKYLKRLGQPSIVRSVALSIVDMTTEEVTQSDEGRSLCIKGKNLRGIWDRTLVASGSDYGSEHGDGEEHMRVPLVTADKEKVDAESWWEANGTVHISWLRGVKKYGGGDFESRRYLENDDKLICESEFHPHRGDKEKAFIQWTFERVG